MDEQRLTDKIMVRVKDYVERQINKIPGNNSEKTQLPVDLVHEKDLLELQKNIQDELKIVTSESRGILLQITTLTNRIEKLEEDYNKQIAELKAEMENNQTSGAPPSAASVNVASTLPTNNPVSFNNFTPNPNPNF